MQWIGSNKNPSYGVLISYWDTEALKITGVRAITGWDNKVSRIFTVFETDADASKLVVAFIYEDSVKGSLARISVSGLSSWMIASSDNSNIWF